MMDEVKRNGIEINLRALSRELGIPVVATIARQKSGMAELLKSIEDVASGKYKCNPHRIKNLSSKLNHAITTLSNKLSVQFPNIPNLRWVALRLLEGDEQIIDAVRTGRLGQLSAGIISD